MGDDPRSLCAAASILNIVIKEYTQGMNEIDFFIHSLCPLCVLIHKTDHNPAEICVHGRYVDIYYVYICTYISIYYLNKKKII